MLREPTTPKAQVDSLSLRIWTQETNTVWLFHGTNDEAAELITKGDFLVDKAGSNAGTLYGRGIYMAEAGSS